MNIVLLNLEGVPSLTLPVMQEILIDKGHVCKSINLSVRNPDKIFFDDLAQRIIAIGDNPGLIGISCMTNTFKLCAALVEHIRKYTDAKIVFGGIHPTVKPHEVLDVADYVCVGEGEEAIVELASRLESSGRTDNIKNIYTKVNGQIVENELRPLIQNLDDLPVPSFNLDNLYIYYQGEILCVAHHQYLLKRVYQVFYFIITSRGCPYRCSYCLSSALINKDDKYRIIRRRSSQHIIEELKNFRRVYTDQVTIGFVDDDLCAQSEQKLEQFLTLYKQEINLPFFVASTPSSITARKMALLCDSGMVRFEIGIQSASDAVNKEIYNRNASQKKLLEAIEIIRPYSNKTTLQFDVILDNPWEQQDTRLETLRFLYNLPRPSTIAMFSLCLYPGTDLYYRALKEGRIQDEEAEIYDKDHMTDIGGDPVNTLFLLFTKLHIPKSLMELLISLLKFKTFGRILVKSRYLLWEMPEYYRIFKYNSARLFTAALKGDLTILKFYWARLLRAMGV